MTDRVIYKIAPRSLWTEAEQSGVFNGAPIDIKDGYIHFSTAAQVAETARLHFSGMSDLILAAVLTEGMGDELRYEPSRAGSLFPHLYGRLTMDKVLWVRPITLDAAGVPQLPLLEPVS